MLTDAHDDYTRGYVPFLDQTIYLDSKPLIPRTETEYWVENAIREILSKDPVRPNTPPRRILDLFAGSGCIGVALLAHIPDSVVTFGEKETRHHTTIRKNVTENGIDPARATVVETDVWRGVAGLFDYVFANPPYVSRERETLDETVMTHEPHEALFAENDGFFFIEETIKRIPQFFTQNGTAYIEHEPFHASRISDIASQNNLAIETHTDQYGVLRYSAFHMA
jgi:release factor glutamine methyltransferase